MLRFDRDHGRNPVERGGGHHWSLSTLRRVSIAFGLTCLVQVFHIDAFARKDIVRPLVSNRDLPPLLSGFGPWLLSGYVFWSS